MTACEFYSLKERAVDPSKIHGLALFPDTKLVFSLSTCGSLDTARLMRSRGLLLSLRRGQLILASREVGSKMCRLVDLEDFGLPIRDTMQPTQRELETIVAAITRIDVSIERGEDVLVRCYFSGQRGLVSEAFHCTSGVSPGPLPSDFFRFPHLEDAPRLTTKLRTVTA